MRLLNSRYRRVSVIGLIWMLCTALFGWGTANHIAYAAGNTWTVNHLADDGSTSCVANAGGSGPACELRDALSKAANGDTIVFSDSLSYPATLMLGSGGTLLIRAGVTINGPGAVSLIVDGAGTYGVFANYGNPTTISGLTVTHGKGTFGGGGITNIGKLTIKDTSLSDNPGGAIVNVGMLTISNSSFSNNSSKEGGAIENLGSMTVNNSRFAHNSSISAGGAIVNTGDLTVSDSSFIGNSAAYGAGIANGMTLTVTDCTFTDNSAIHPAGDGGAIKNGRGTVSINNSTIVGNSANQGGGISNVLGVAVVNNTTITNNSSHQGGGIYFEKDKSSTAAINLGSTIVAGNKADDGLDLYTASNSTITSMGYNLIGNNSGASVTNVSNDQIGTSANPLDPLLSPLAANGGPTQTMALQSGSPAIGKGFCAWPTTNTTPSPIAITIDQRGVTRKTNCDVGAYETGNSS